jgi:hypothetical protein
LRVTFTNVTIGLVGLIFGVSAAYVGGVYSFSKTQGSIEEQQKQFANQQNQSVEEMKEIKTQLIRINNTMDVILDQHKNSFGNK